MHQGMPDDDKPVYSFHRPTYSGECEGGPQNGFTYASTELTVFITRKVERTALQWSGRSLMGLSVQERTQLEEAEKAAMKEAIWARANPHRYDFDLSRKIWVYVEYTLSPMDEI